MIQSSISLSLEVQPCIKNKLTFRNRRHHRLVRKRGSKLTVKPGTKRQISLHRGTTWVTSMSPNAKLTLSLVSQVLYLNATRARFPAEIWAVQHLIYRRGGESIANCLYIVVVVLHLKLFNKEPFSVLDSATCRKFWNLSDLSPGCSVRYRAKLCQVYANLEKTAKIKLTFWTHKMNA